MKPIIIISTITFLTVYLFFSCQNSNPAEIAIEQKWNLKTLENRAEENLNSKNWNISLLKQDVETYNKYSEIFEQYPLNNYPFPVADYDYAVYSNPFTIKKDSLTFKGIQIGEYNNPKSDSLTTKLILLVLTNNGSTEIESFVDSRNFPYLTAEGNFNLSENNFRWVFQASPDGFSSLFFSMKLFDLRFGQTIIIYPQKDNSFLYKQIDESPNNYSKVDYYIEKIKKNLKR